MKPSSPVIPGASLPETKVTVTVCSACLRASCWLDRFPCDRHATAGTVEKTLDELRALNLEHPSFWRAKKGDDLREVWPEASKAVWVSAPGGVS